MKYRQYCDYYWYFYILFTFIFALLLWHYFSNGLEQKTVITSIFFILFTVLALCFFLTNKIFSRVEINTEGIKIQSFKITKKHYWSEIRSISKRGVNISTGSIIDFLAFQSQFILTFTKDDGSKFEIVVNKKVLKYIKGLTKFEVT